MVDGRLNTHLGRTDEHTAADTDDGCGGNQRRGRCALDTVEDHRDEAKEVDASTAGDEELVVLRVLDQEGDAEGGDGCCKCPHLYNATRIGDGLALHNEQVRLEVGVYREVVGHCAW